MLNYSNQTDLKMLVALVPEGVPRTKVGFAPDGKRNVVMGGGERHS